jgi:cbb3-type cytochrome oxidase subunit 3
MKFIAREWPKIVIIVLLVFIIIIFFSLNPEKPVKNNSKADLALNLKPEGNYDQFYVDKLTLVRL